ncbi:MAG TPA: hypothetical protein VJ774_00645 [Actinomycetota bacterium]|nr:hypothetical protein [Actinomycetota bacterium]
MTDLTDPVQVDTPGTTAEPDSPAKLPAETPAPRIKRKRSESFTVRTSAAAHSYASWERAIGAARSFAVEFGMTSSVTDDFNGTGFDVAPDGCASPRSL